MRTTVILDDQLVRAAKHHAAERGTSLSAVLNHALRDALASPRPGNRMERFAMPTFGTRPGRDTTPRDIARLRDE